MILWRAPVRVSWCAGVLLRLNLSWLPPALLLTSSLLILYSITITFTSLFILYLLLCNHFHWSHSVWLLFRKIFHRQFQPIATYARPLWKVYTATITWSFTLVFTHTVHIYICAYRMVKQYVLNYISELYLSRHAQHKAFYTVLRHSPGTRAAPQHFRRQIRN